VGSRAPIHFVSESAQVSEGGAVCHDGGYDAGRPESMQKYLPIRISVERYRCRLNPEICVLSELAVALSRKLVARLNSMAGAYL